MSKRHDAVFDDVLAGLGESDTPGRDRSGARFLKRSNTMAEQVAGERQEKVLRLVDPAACVMWSGHNRAYDLLTEQNCRDLIDGMLSQGKQEFPAVVRRLRPAQDGQGPEFEVICGARRHFAVSWLRANNYPQFRYLVEERTITDEEAFRLADIENRDREDISDLERARDYAKAVEAYYQGKQNLMAERLQVSAGWLSRYLQLAKLDDRIVSAFASLRDVKELHARQLKPLMASEEGRADVLAEADILRAEQAQADIPAAKVLSRLKSAAMPPKKRSVADHVYRQSPSEQGVQLRRRGSRILFEFDKALDDNSLRQALEQFIADRGVGNS